MRGGSSRRLCNRPGSRRSSSYPNRKGRREIRQLQIKAYSGSVKCSVVQAARKTRGRSCSMKSYTIEFIFDGRQFRWRRTAGRCSAKFGRFSTP